MAQTVSDAAAAREPVPVSGVGGRAPAMGGRGRWVALVALLLLASVIGGAGMASLPPDEHEVLVLRTATEMHARGDWLVPYFDGAPRLNKPPLSYWLTGATAVMSGAGGAIMPWHGRLPSLLAGLGMVAVIVLAGSRLYGARAASLGGLLFATSAAFYAYSHDARPDGLYAFWCSAGLAVGATALLGASARPRRALVLMWVCYALATLTKGPHIPALLLVGSGLWLKLERRQLAELMPGRGLALFCAIAAPWWIALRLALGDGDSRVEDSQLAGSLLRPSYQHLLNAYYLYRPLQLLVPWVPLALIGWWALWRAGRRPASAVTMGLPALAAADRYFALAVLAVVVGLSFGSQQRYFYLLPAVPALCLLAGRGASLLLARAWPWWVQSVVTVAPVAYLLVASGAGRVGIAAAAAAVLVGGAIGWSRVAGTGRVPAGGRPLAHIAACALLATVVYVMPATSARLWSGDRQVTAALARTVAEQVPAAAALAAFELTPEVYVYIAARLIPRLAGLAALDAWRAGVAGQAQFLLVEVERAQQLGRRYRLEPVALMPPGADDRAGLYRVLGER